VPGELTPRLVAAGLGAVAGSAATFVLPAKLRYTGAGPALAGLCLALFGLGQWVWGLPSAKAAAGLVALASLVVLLLPWIGLAQVPVRLDALAGSRRAEAEPAVDLEEVRHQLAGGDVLVVALRIGCGVTVVALAPAVVTSLFGGLLMAAVALSLLLGTRRLYGAAEVYIGLVSGAVTLTLTGVLTALRAPQLLPWTAGAAALVAAIVVANNVLATTARPALARVADGCHVIALATILPLTALVWGVL